MPRSSSASPDRRYDAVAVGSGINALVAAALLARAGWRVCVLERNAWLGGAVRTEELTLPGFRHEVFSAWHPQFLGSQAYALLGDELARRGVEYLHAAVPAAQLHTSGEPVVLTRSHQENAAALERLAAGDGDAWTLAVEAFHAESPLVRALLGREPTAAALLRLLPRLARTRGLLASTRSWAGASFRSEHARALFATWGLHAGVGPADRASAVMARAVTIGKELAGSPVPRGGGTALVEALAGIVRDAGGACEPLREVDRVLVSGGRAAAVRTTDGETVAAGRAVLAGVTPPQLYGRLLAGAHVSRRARVAAGRFHFGRAGMVIHMALSEPPRWAGDDRLGAAAIVHLTGGLESVARAVAEAERGLLPAEATVVVGQPVAVDPGRAPAGSWILWIQLHELPARPLGDAAGELDTGDGMWSERLREQYADRIQARVARHAPNLNAALLARAVLSPADLEAANPNLVGGDMYAGALTFAQRAAWRPRPLLRGHRTPVRGLYLIGASTQPGPGLSGGSGTIVADELLRRS